MATSVSFTACLFYEHYLAFPCFMWIGIHFGLRPIRLILLAFLQTVTRYWPRGQSMVFVSAFRRVCFGMLVKFFSLVSAPHTRSTFFGPGLAIAHQGQYGT